MAHRCTLASLAAAALAAGCASATPLPARWSEAPAPEPVAPVPPADGLEAAMGPLLASVPGHGLDSLGWPRTVRLDEKAQDLPTVEVRGQPSSEEDKVGSYGQPEWTTQRRFARSRAYVLPEGQWEVETWYRGKYDNGHDSGRLFQAEIEVGLPHRLQLDYYQNFADAPGAGFEDAGPQVEGRWALADWGVLPWNPTIYGEYKWDRTGADKVEMKGLFADTVAPRWHAAANVIWEQETSGGRDTELGLSGALSRTVIDRRLGVGVEVTLSRVSGRGFRGDAAWELAAGPSIQYRFTEHSHLDIVPMIGLSKDAHDLELFVVFGIDFGGGGEGLSSPTSTRSK